MNSRELDQKVAAHFHVENAADSRWGIASFWACIAMAACFFAGAPFLLHVWRTGLGLCSTLGAGCLWVAYQWRRQRRIHSRYRWSISGCCLSCGYDLTGNTSGVCPECGARIDPEAYRHAEPDPKREDDRLWKTGTTFGLCVVALVGLLVTASFVAAAIIFIFQ